MRAPISGRISDKKIDVGNLVIGGQVSSTLMATIVTTDPIHFVFDASEADYMRYARLNQSGARPSSRTTANPVRVKLADETDWAHEGVMDFVDNSFNQRSGTIRGRALLSNKDDLLTPGIFARIRALRRRHRCVPDSRCRDHLRSGAQDRLHSQRRRRHHRDTGDARSDVRGLARHQGRAQSRRSHRYRGRCKSGRPSRHESRADQRRHQGRRENGPKLTRQH